jgi:hypothetical protein
MAHQAGPSSLKLAALSAYSYHLDSPPFTGTAGPLGDNNDDYDRLNSSLRDHATNLADDEISPDGSGDNTPAATSRAGGGNRERIPTNGSGRRLQSRQGMHEGLQEREEIYARHHNSDHQRNDNGDVPSWHLEGKTPPHRQETPDQRSLAADGSSSHFLSNSLSPPPFSSDAVGPLAGQSLEKSNSQRREASRPAFAQVSSTTLSNEDASSSGATDADADVDADEEEEHHDAEADGNDTAVIPKSPFGAMNGFASKVPTQSQTKVRSSHNLLEAFS